MPLIAHHNQSLSMVNLGAAKSQVSVSKSQVSTSEHIHTGSTINSQEPHLTKISPPISSTVSSITVHTDSLDSDVKLESRANTLNETGFSLNLGVQNMSALLALSSKLASSTKDELAYTLQHSFQASKEEVSDPLGISEPTYSTVSAIENDVEDVEIVTTTKSYLNNTVDGDEFNQSEHLSDTAQRQQELELQLLAELSKRDAEVKAHEQAHSMVGGHLAQQPQFRYEIGSDGQRYAVDGEVSIDVTPIVGNPQATINKMNKVYAAAMAPNEPSAADIRVAAEAVKLIRQAREELVEQRQDRAFSIEQMKPMIDAQSYINNINSDNQNQDVESGLVGRDINLEPITVGSDSEHFVLNNEQLNYSTEVITNRYRTV